MLIELDEMVQFDIALIRSFASCWQGIGIQLFFPPAMNVLLTKLLPAFFVLLAFTAKVEAETPETIEEALKCMLFVQTYDKAGKPYAKGSGFIVDDGGTQWIYTNAHVLEGALRIDFTDSEGNKLLKFGKFQCFSKESGGGIQGVNRFGGDGVRLELKERRELAFVISKTPEKFPLNAKVTTIGDNAGDLTMEVLDGNVTAISKTIIQSTCKSQSGSSGGALLDPDSFEVIGLNTFGLPGNIKLTDAIWQIGVDENVDGASILHSAQWIDMDVGKFLEGSEVAMKFRDTVKMLAFIYNLVQHEDGYKIEPGNRFAAALTFEQAFDQFEDNPLLVSVIDLNRKLSNYSGKIAINNMDLVRIYAKSLTGIRNSYREQRQKLPQDFAPYYLINFEQSGFYEMGDYYHDGLGDAEAWFVKKAKVGGAMPVGRWFNLLPFSEFGQQ